MMIQGQVFRAIILLGLMWTAASAQVEINGIAAKVNGLVITKKEVAFQVLPQKMRLQAKYPRGGEAYERELQDVQDQVVEQLIENKLVLSQAKEMGAAIPDHVVLEEETRIINDNFNGKEEEYLKFLKTAKMTRRAFRQDQKEKILIQAFRMHQFGGDNIAPPLEDEIRAHYNERKLELRDRTKDVITYRKIFIAARDPRDPNVTPEQRLAKAEVIMKRLQGGADFAEMAKKESDGAFASEGGLWEDTPRTDLSPVFAELLFEAEVGELVGPLKDPAGFTIMQVIKKEYGPSPEYGEVRKKMKKEIEIKKRSKKYDKWMKILKRKAMIERRM